MFIPLICCFQLNEFFWCAEFLRVESFPTVCLLSLLSCITIRRVACNIMTNYFVFIFTYYPFYAVHKPQVLLRSKRLDFVKRTICDNYQDIINENRSYTIYAMCVYKVVGCTLLLFDYLEAIT